MKTVQSYGFTSSRYMNLKYTHTRLLVTKFSDCFKFYRDVLEFPVTLGEPDGVYAEFQTGGSILALFRRDFMAQVVATDHLPSSASAQDPVVLTFAVPNVDDAYRALSDQGVKFLAPPADQPDWFIRVAHFRDPQGNLLEINSPLKG